ncbi:MAG TPA: hypothetical protein PKD53_03610 [Chloroflexaceae bacterium]|nr:hypothetical protein [Chloroflexaceae bacterium]
MSRPSLIWPVTVLAAFAALLILLVVAALPTPSVAQDGCVDAYPTPGPERDDCYRTATARTGQGGGAYPDPTATTGQQAPQPTVTLTVTPTLTITGTLAPTATAGPTSTPTATRQPQGSPTPSATSTLVGLETLTCAPGASVAVVGRADPNTALLLYFDERPVGGALSRSDGSYQIVLNVGRERPGTYPLTVRVRDSRALVRELACEVPGAPPTPTAFPPLAATPTGD